MATSALTDRCRLAGSIASVNRTRFDRGGELRGSDTADIGGPDVAKSDRDYVKSAPGPDVFGRRGRLANLPNAFRAGGT